MSDARVNLAESNAEGLADWGDPSALAVDAVRDLFQTLTKALRAYQLYDENNPVYQRFVSNLREAFRELWTEADRLQVQVEEERLAWYGEEVYRSDNRADSLAFTLFKDGIREIVFLPGIEEEELEGFLRILQRARSTRAEEDDLLTILWEADLEHLRYNYVDVLAEGADALEAPEGTAVDLSDVLEGELRPLHAEGEEEDETEEDAAAALQAAATELTQSVHFRAEDFNPTLYSLDAREMEQLGREVAREMERDLRGDVLAALFDRLEDPGDPERQSEILEIFRILLPNFLSRSELSAAAEILRELEEVRAKENVLDAARSDAVDRILDEVSMPEALQELVRALQDGSLVPSPRELAEFLAHLRPSALGPLLRAAELTEEKELRPVLQEAIRGMAERNRKQVIQLLGSPDPVVVAGACRLAGRTRLEEAGPVLGRLVSHESQGVRLAAIEATVSLRASVAAGALVGALQDPDREVRIAAARGLGELRYAPAARRLRHVIGGRPLRKADLSEKIAFFESYGRLAEDDAVDFLDGVLNGRGFLGRREPADLRACAALALGKVGTPAALATLEAARGESDPIVRSAVNRALREGEE